MLSNQTTPMRRYPKKQKRYGGIGLRMLRKINKATENAIMNHRVAYHTFRPDNRRHKKWVRVVKKWRAKLRTKFSYSNYHYQ